MSVSSDEREIRDAVVARLRELLPSARIIHELNVAGQGSFRIDVAAVSRNTIVAVEIKSKKDTLKRLAHQVDAFSACSHLCMVAAHRKHFVEYVSPYNRRDDWPKTIVLNHELGAQHEMRDKVWCFPFNSDFEIENQFCNGKEWSFPARWQDRIAPAAKPLLDMLWASELKAECARHRIKTSSRSTIRSMIKDMVDLMTGREVVQAVCRQLRERSFAEADAPVFEAAISALVEVAA